MDDERILKSMRGALWQDAKGKLQAILSTYWGYDEKFSLMAAAIKEFVKKVEDGGFTE